MKENDVTKYARSTLKAISRNISKDLLNFTQSFVSPIENKKSIVDNTFYRRCLVLNIAFNVFHILE